MDAFLRNAEQILDTAVRAKDCGTPEYLISVSHRGAIQILSESAGWSLAALAAEYGSFAVYRVKRQGRLVRVEGWSSGRNCVLSRDESVNWWSRPCAAGVYATRKPVELTGGSAKDLWPQVWNS
jgi:hypothetical protein